MCSPSKMYVCTYKDECMEAYIFVRMHVFLFVMKQGRYIRVFYLNACVSERCSV